MAKMKPQTTEAAATKPRTPRIVGEEDAPAPRPNAGDNRPFVLIWPIGGYSMLGDGRGGYFIAPRLIEQRMESGLGGCVQLRDGSWDMSGLIADSKQSRKRVLPMHLDYCLEFDRDCWRPAWSTVTSDGRVVLSPALYADWVRGLMENGIIPPPGPEELSAIVRQHEILLEQASSKFQPGSRAIKDAEKLHAAAVAASAGVEEHAQ